MSQRPAAPRPAVARSPEDLERIAALHFRQALQRTVARALSIVFATVAVAAVLTFALEFVRARHRADGVRDCLAAAEQLPNFADRVALITRAPSCASVVDVTRSR